MSISSLNDIRSREWTIFSRLRNFYREWTEIKKFEKIRVAYAQFK